MKKIFCTASLLVLFVSAAAFGEVYRTVDYYGNDYVVYVHGNEVSGSSTNGLVCYGSVQGNSLLVYFFDGRSRMISRKRPTSDRYVSRQSRIIVFPPESSMQPVAPAQNLQHPESEPPRRLVYIYRPETGIYQTNPNIRVQTPANGAYGDYYLSRDW